MKRIRLRFVKWGCVSALALIAAAALVGCGDEANSSDDSRKFNVTVSQGSMGSTGPDSIEAGLAAITLINRTKGGADLRLVRTEGDRSAEEVLQAVTDALGGQSLPDWLFFAGGPPAVASGGSTTVKQVMRPGRYYGFFAEGPSADLELLFLTEVTGEATGEEIDGEFTIEATEYSFDVDPEPLPSGASELAFKNVGNQPHRVTFAKLRGDATAEDAKSFWEGKESAAPYDFENLKATAIIEGGESQLVTLGLEPGRYAIYSYVTDREGGAPQALKGMVDEVEVE